MDHSTFLNAWNLTGRASLRVRQERESCNRFRAFAVYKLYAVAT